MKTRHPILASAILLATLAGCAHAPSDPAALAEYQENNDPAEPTNRAVFGANQAVDRTVLKPVATTYRDNVPDGVQRGVHNFVSNLGEPKVLVNDLLQGNLRRAWNTTQRFAVNSTVGAAGVFDVAGRQLGLEGHGADFGQTFGVWGVPPGPAMHLPLLGPSNVRDAVGAVMGFVADPLARIPGNTITTITSVGTGGGLLDTRSRLLSTTDALEKDSLDYYATLRSVSAQRRAAIVQEGKVGAVQGMVAGEGLAPTAGATSVRAAP